MEATKAPEATFTDTERLNFIITMGYFPIGLGEVGVAWNGLPDENGETQLFQGPVRVRANIDSAIQRHVAKHGAEVLTEVLGRNGDTVLDEAGGMSADRELLELAAKAAGYALSERGRADGAFIVLTNEDGDYIWNPLGNYSDAIRLAKDLSLPVASSAILNGDGVATSGYVDAHFARENYAGGLREKHAAVCRAIVRAAAEIGRTM